MSSSSYETSSSDGTSSGGNSPKSAASGFDEQMRQVTPQMPKPSRKQARNADGYLCNCRRGTVRAYGRCGWCLRDAGWA